MKPSSAVKIESVECENVFETDDPLELLACRVCLATDTKLFNLHDFKLAKIFGDITGTPVSPSDGLPQHLCAICRALLSKSSVFRSRCHSAHLLLQDLRVQQIMITTSNVRRIDRIGFRYSLTTSKPTTIAYIPSEHEERTDSRFIEDLVKSEALFEIPSKLIGTDIEIEEEFRNELMTVDFLDNNDFYFDDGKVEDKVPVKWKKKKESKSKKIKEKKIKVKTEEIKQELEEFSSGLDDVDDVDDSDADCVRTRTRSKHKKAKRKRPYNRKFEEDFIGFSKLYNVDVEFLSKDQQLADVEARQASDAYKNARFRCESCFRGFMTERAYKKHVVWHDPASGTHACDVCKQYYPTRDKLLSHLRKHRMHFTCRTCNYVSKDSTKAKQHHKWHEGLKYECRHCGRNFNAKSTQLNHIRENHTAVACDICGDTIAGTIELSRHKATHTKMVNCANCGMEFHSDEALHRHASSVNNCSSDRVIKSCALCGEGFGTSDLLRRHVEDQHKGTIYRCEDCGASFVSDRSLSIHWKRVHGAGEKPPPGAAPRHYMCEVCAHSYPTEVQLKYHQRVHTGERPHQCPMCPKRFRMHTNLRVHINTHTGERPYKCALCPEMFKSYSQRHKHKLLVHTKERRYKCSMCEKTYVVSFDLKEHIRFSHMKIPRPPRNRRRKKPDQVQVPMTLNALAGMGTS